MAKEEWGTKRVCPTTGKRFYDLGRDPIVSPYTGEQVVPESGKGGRMMVADKAEKSESKSTEEGEDDVVLEENNNDSEVDLGDDVLEDDDDSDNVSLDDIADVAENDDDS